MAAGVFFLMHAVCLHSSVGVVVEKSLMMYVDWISETRRLCIKCFPAMYIVTFPIDYLEEE